ncbi:MULTISPECIES: NAD(P)-binding domain-containing protein [unclassified Dietzia]|uniref:NAD(P)-binding domain-containing protein n=1 Tax=unclassified Dietzia TaxID=2617939 RepID=UPI0015FAC509|nr:MULTISPECIES: NAD(P)/FAD-dependent oxidoreductase [unclassified Dietzia]MBB1024335.1 NAD(P)/FAD-dependent oxidoreductase [Dietzia sp. DQ12-76]MBB1028832.1 NAD(P)/FAD-dependent oxidoreductase [Dietzia sp. DQ11-38-2]
MTAVTSDAAASDTVTAGPDTSPDTVTAAPDSRRLPDAEERLAALRARVHEDIATTSHSRDWIPRDPGSSELDVLVIGGGQAGLGTAFALQRQRIDRVLVVDDGPEQQVGCWDRYARMHTLRSPKHMRGIEFDVPSLHVRRWFEAVYGEAAWAAVELVPRLDWNDYLRWYREVTGVRVRHQTRVTAIHRPATPDGPFSVELSGPAGNETTVTARRIVCALGLAGGGGPRVPDLISSSLPRERWFHTEDPIDFAALRGQRVAVLGGGASGFDNAATALDHGAVRAHVFVRRETLPASNPLRWMEFPGMQERFYDLDDEAKWEFGVMSGGLPQPPTQHSVWRCFAHSGFALHTGCGWKAVSMVSTDAGEQEIAIDTDRGRFHADVVLAATGYTVDLRLRPELAEFVDDIALWSDRHPPAMGHPAGSSPYLGPGFEFTERDPGTAPWLSRLHHFSTGARASMGVTGNQLSGIYGGIGRIASTITTAITRENWGRLAGDFASFEHIEVRSVGPHDASDGWYPTSSRF